MGRNQKGLWKMLSPMFSAATACKSWRGVQKSVPFRLCRVENATVNNQECRCAFSILPRWECHSEQSRVHKLLTAQRWSLTYCFAPHGSHGNAVDIGEMMPFMAHLCGLLNCSIFSYDYSGYGMVDYLYRIMMLITASVSAFLFRVWKCQHFVFRVWRCQHWCVIPNTKLRRGSQM